MCLKYFSETAHNPETNQRPGRLKTVKTAMTPGSELRFHRGRDSSPIYQTVWDHHHRGSVSGAIKPSAATRFVSPHRTPSVRRSSTTDTNGGGNYLHHRNKPSSSTINPKSRHSMDVGVACRDGLLLQHENYHHMQHQVPPDDSIIMSRIKKSLEQKEEFLRRPVPSQSSQNPAKEFYSRPQKLTPPVWPPSQQQSESSSAVVDPCQTLPQTIASKPKSKQFVNKLSKIHEDGKSSANAKTAGAATTDTEQHLKQTNLQVVSMRAKQFESGKMDDKTDFYKSELARLSSKHNVPNVAVRKMEYEQKLHSDKKQPTASQQEIRDESITSCSSKYTYDI